MKNYIVLSLVLFILLPASLMAESQQSFENERFGKISTYGKASGTLPTVVYFTDGDGWDEKSVGIAKTISAQAFLIGINTKKYLKGIRRDDRDQECSYLAGEIERLAQSVEKSSKRSNYQKVIIIGVGEGAALAFAIYHQHPTSFAGLMTLDFNGELELSVPPCAAPAFQPQKQKDKILLLVSENKTDPNLWKKLSAQADPKLTQYPNLKSEFDALAAYVKSTAASAPSSENNSHLIEIPAKGRAQKFFAIFVSGDGGWATIDRDIGDYLANHQIAVVGFDSLKYFWKKRTPEESARELERVISKYLRQWEKTDVILLGFSMGADVLPFMYNRLSADIAERVRFAGFLSPGKTTDFEVNISDWIGASEEQEAYDISAEIAKIKDVPLACFYGEDEREVTACTIIKQKNAIIKGFPGTHHFNGEYKKISLELIKLLPR